MQNIDYTTSRQDPRSKSSPPCWSDSPHLASSKVFPILADVVPYIGQHYRSVVIDETGEIRQPEDFVGLAQPSYNGYRWDQTHQHVVKDETPIENLISE